MKILAIKTLHEKKNFRLTKIFEKCRKDHNFVCFRVFPFHGYIMFSELSFKRKLRKQHLSANTYFRVNMNFSYMIAWRKDEIFCRNVTKTSDFLLVFRLTFRWRYLSENMKFSVALQRKQAIAQPFVEDVYIFPIISFSLKETWS